MEKLKEIGLAIGTFVGVLGTPIVWAFFAVSRIDRTEVAVIGFLIGCFVSYWAYKGIDSHEKDKEER